MTQITYYDNDVRYTFLWGNTRLNMSLHNIATTLSSKKITSNGLFGGHGPCRYLLSIHHIPIFYFYLAISGLQVCYD